MQKVNLDPLPTSDFNFISRQGPNCELSCLQIAKPSPIPCRLFTRSEWSNVLKNLNNFF